jgi:hypothetical protein
MFDHIDHTLGYTHTISLQNNEPYSKRT